MRLNQIIRHLTGCKRGATAVEFGLIVPVMLVFVIGTFEISRALMIKNVMQFAVEEAGRYAIVNTSMTTSEITTYAESIVTSFTPSGIVYTATTETVGTLNFMDIQATYTFVEAIGLIPIPDIDMTAKSRVLLN